MLNKEEKNKLFDEIINTGLSLIDNLDKDSFHKVKNNIYKKYNISKPIPSVELIKRYNEMVAKNGIEENLKFKKILRRRGVRSQSGVTVISLLTKSFGCPGKCIYCPSFEKLPKSYIPNEPAVMRAELNKFDPIMQIHNRLRALETTGHKINKNDVRIIGGTWSFYPKEYQKDFIKGIYDAFNTYHEMKQYIEETDLSSQRFASFKIKEGYKLRISSSLDEAKKINETAECRIIGIAIETRPDWIDYEEIKRIRSYGVTRVEIGYQTTNDKINELNKRGHGNKESIEATKLLKDTGIKVVAHMMPNLLGSTPEEDIISFKEIYDNPDYRPDELKIYPMVVTEKSELTDIWRNGGFKSYDDEALIKLTAELECLIPEYVRLNRTYRDIPAHMILEGSKLSNLRQLVEQRINKKGIKLIDIRHREIKDKNNDPKKAILNTYRYEASGGIEYFLTFEDPEDRTIFSLLRFRIPSDLENNKLYDYIPEIKGASLIREIHTFGDQLSIGEKGGKEGQHLGFGKKLVAEAERLSKDIHNINKVAVISGVGVRGYYEKRGYHLEGEYMIKKL